VPATDRIQIESKEAAVVLRIFTSYAEGMPLTKIVKTLNEESVPGAIRSAKGWSPATISRILDNENTPAVTPDIGRPFYRAVTTIDALSLTESPPAGAEGGSNSLQRWRRRELTRAKIPAPDRFSSGAAP
jgi:hypothetical protein